MYVYEYVSVYVGKDKWEIEKSEVGKENGHDDFHLKPFSDRSGFVLRFYFYLFLAVLGPCCCEQAF